MSDTRGEVISRLHRLEGQLRGVERLIDQSRPLPLILQQLQAADSAVRSLMVSLVEDRLRQNENGAIEIRPDEANWIKKLIR